MTERTEIKPEDIAYSESDGAVSINAAAVANHLNAMQRRIEQLEAAARRGCTCMNCVVIGI